MQVDFVHNDRALVEKAMKGNRQAQYRLYQNYSRGMFSICWRMLNNREEAEDILQESFTDAFLKLHTFRFESTFGAWLKQIVVNKCINAIKKKKIDIEYQENVFKKDLPDESMDEDELIYEVEKVRKAIQLLPDGYRIILSLYLLEGYDHEEIAEILNISESTSKTQYMRAKNKIKEILKSA
ncbi:MAG TPA: RNA polymerase sigma factor [Bacteroidia bacterium]|nr:RNA polymerase sigma factor [Bacteroidia bacterium]HRU67910.1 RNA polymerase sigma factor [Bacteroidia bacterium]